MNQPIPPAQASDCATCEGHGEVSVQASDEPMRADFWKFIATLPTPVQDNISTSEARGESITAKAFESGYTAALATPRATADVERDEEDRSTWTFKQWYEHVGAWETPEGFISFGSPMAVRAMLIQYGRAALKTQPAPTEAQGDPTAEQYDEMLRSLCSYWGAGGNQSDGLISPDLADEKLRFVFDQQFRAGVEFEKSRVAQVSANVSAMSMQDFELWFNSEYPRIGERRPKYQESGVMALMLASWTAALSTNPNLTTSGATYQPTRNAGELAKKLASRAGLQPVPANSYTCNGKGGDYEFIGTAHGAGTSRDRGCVLVYMDMVDGAFYFRTPTDFADRMTAVPAQAGTVAQGEDSARLDASDLATIEEATKVLESAAKHNEGLGRTVFAHAQRDRAARLRAILNRAAPQPQGAES